VKALPVRRRLWRGPVLVLLLPALLCTAAWMAGELYKQRDPLPDLLASKADLAAVIETPLETRTGYSLVHVRLRDQRGLEVEGHLRLPSGAQGRHGAIVILGGLRTGRWNAELLPPIDGWAVLALDYPHAGAKRGLSRWELVRALPALRRAALDTVPATGLALDYLWRRDDIDRERIVLTAGSFGALIAPAAAAAEARFSAVALLFGAGDLGALIHARLDMPWPARPIVAWLGGVFFSALEPLKYVGRIAPRPLLLLNGTEDSAMPERCSRLLHEKAGPQATVRWLPLGHVSARAGEFRRSVLPEVLRWLATIGGADRRYENDLRSDLNLADKAVVPDAELPVPLERAGRQNSAR